MSTAPLARHPTQHRSAQGRIYTFEYIHSALNKHLEEIKRHKQTIQHHVPPIVNMSFFAFAERNFLQLKACEISLPLPYEECLRDESHP